MNNLDHLRNTGRTTRMIDEAIRLTEQGRTVYLIVANHNEVKRLRDRLTNYPAIKIETPQAIGNFDWRTMQLRGAHPNCAALVDHYAIEAEFGQMLEMLHRFDA